ncbi:MAG: transglycosylase SLT domain-containing protein, partial [Sutterella sp.]|nr:transglycosylase SLT domain-containing protein [Sutterella sp.]
MIRPLQIRPFLLKTLPLLSLGFTFLLFEPAAGIPKAAAAAGVPAADEAATVAQAASDEPVGTVEALGPPVDVWDRIRRGYAMPALENDKVDRWLEYYRRKPDYLNRMFERSGRYLYHILEEVENRGMPTELALLPFVESAFQPEALSRAKAAGLWQFMPATGTHYSLEQNLWRDDRRDVLESTRAALDYFEYLYGMFSDWHLALAAYNWGEGSVQRAIRRQQARKRPADYQHLRMPNETANYVPKLEAIKRIVTDPSKYGVKLPDVGNEPFFVTVTKPRDIDT